MKCCFCNKTIDKYNLNEINPIKTTSENAKCCNDCNTKIVIPTRLNMLNILKLHEKL